MELWYELVLATKLLNTSKQILISLSCLNSKKLLLMKNVYF